MRIDPAGWPFILGTLLVPPGSSRGWDTRSGPLPIAVLAGFFLFFFRDPERQTPAGGRRRHLAGRRPRGDCRRGEPATGAARAVAANQHFPVADGRAREPGARCRAASPRSSTGPANSCRPTGARRHRQRAQRGLDRSRGADGRLPAGGGHPGAPDRVPRRPGRGGQAGAALRRDEVRIAHRSVSCRADATLRVAVGDRVAVRRDGRWRTLRLRAGAAECGVAVPFRRRLRNPLRRRTDVEQRRFRRGVYILPSLFTLGNMFCGYACVIYAMRGEYEKAAPFIGIAIVLDMLDGRIARMTGSDERLRPAVRFAGRRDLVRHGAGDPRRSVGLASLGRLGWAAAFLFVTAAALRLARFNIQAPTGDKRYFVGMPSPAAAGIPAATVFLYPVRAPRPARGAARARDGDRAGAADGEHDPVPQLQDDRPADAPALPRADPLRARSSRWSSRTRSGARRCWRTAICCRPSSAWPGRDCAARPAHRRRGDRRRTPDQRQHPRRRNLSRTVVRARARSPLDGAAVQLDVALRNRQAQAGARARVEK